MAAHVANAGTCGTLQLMLDSIKRRLSGFLRWHVTEPICDMQMELAYQKIFDNQCRNAEQPNDFYPLGASASYGLMFLLFRVFEEHHVNSVVEFGSGQTTLLIDRIKADHTRHVCYEHDPVWHARLSARLSNCDYRLRPLRAATIEGRETQWYSDVIETDFDLILIDGPVGTERYSRFGCVELIRSLRSNDFLIILDDCQRQGERDTAAYVVDLLRTKGLEFHANQLHARTTQTVIAGGRFAGATYYY